MNEPLVIFVRGFISFLTMMIFTRIIGKQQVSQLTFFDYVLGITIGSIAATLTTDTSVRPLPQWIGLVTWAGAGYAMHVISIKSIFLSKYIDGEPTIIIMNGQIMEDAMRKMNYRLSDLLEQMRAQGYFDISQIEFAILETSGQLSVLAKSQYRPANPKDLNISTEYQGMTTELIYDGVIIDQNLKQINLDRNWLNDQLKTRGIKDISEVFFASLNTKGELYIDTYQDHVKTPLDISDFPGSE